MIASASFSPERTETVPGTEPTVNTKRRRKHAFLRALIFIKPITQFFFSLSAIAACAAARRAIGTRNGEHET